MNTTETSLLINYNPEAEYERAYSKGVEEVKAARKNAGPYLSKGNEEECVFYKDFWFVVVTFIISWFTFIHFFIDTTPVYRIRPGDVTRTAVHKTSEQLALLSIIVIPMVIGFVITPLIDKRRPTWLPFRRKALARKFNEEYPFPVRTKDFMKPESLKLVVNSKLSEIYARQEFLNTKLTTTEAKLNSSLENVTQVITKLQRLPVNMVPGMLINERLTSANKVRSLLIEDLQKIKDQRKDLKDSYALVASNVEQLQSVYTLQEEVKIITDAYLDSENFRAEYELNREILQRFNELCSSTSQKVLGITKEVDSLESARVEVLSTLS